MTPANKKSPVYRGFFYCLWVSDENQCSLANEISGRQRRSEQREDEGFIPSNPATPATAQIKIILWIIFRRKAMRYNEFKRQCWMNWYRNWDKSLEIATFSLFYKYLYWSVYCVFQNASFFSLTRTQNSKKPLFSILPCRDVKKNIPKEITIYLTILNPKK